MAMYFILLFVLSSHVNPLSIDVKRELCMYLASNLVCPQPQKLQVDIVGKGGVCFHVGVSIDFT